MFQLKSKTILINCPKCGTDEWLVKVSANKDEIQEIYYDFNVLKRKCGCEFIPFKEECLLNYMTGELIDKFLS